MALAVLADGWARAQGGQVTALLVDHGLRPAAASEVALAHAALARRGIAGIVLRLTDLARGPGLAARARHARHVCLRAECARLGVLHLLLGHHAADQAETLLMRAQAGSHDDGLAGIAALREWPEVRVLRPLLYVAPAALRDLLQAAGMAWCEDPSNTDPAAQRARLRALRADPDGTGPATLALAEAASRFAAHRAEAERGRAVMLAQSAALFPEGYAVLRTLPSARILAGLLCMLGGGAHPPGLAAVGSWLARPRAATLAGVQFRPVADGGWLLLREAAAMAPPVLARHGTIWDGRFRLLAPGGIPDGTMLGALGQDAPAWRAESRLPAAVLRTLPALRLRGAVWAVPSLVPVATLDTVLAPANLAVPPVFVGLPPPDGRCGAGGWHPAPATPYPYHA